jgi:hypothetical protein
MKIKVSLPKGKPQYSVEFDPTNILEAMVEKARQILNADIEVNFGQEKEKDDGKRD